MDFEEVLTEMIKNKIDEVISSKAVEKEPVKETQKETTPSVKREFRPYCQEEDTTIDFLYLERDLTQSQIAGLLGRTPGAIGQRLSTKGIRKSRAVEVRKKDDNRSHFEDFNPSNLETFRKHRGLTQLQLAQSVYMHVAHIKALEKGEMKPYKDVAEKLAKALRIPIEDLSD